MKKGLVVLLNGTSSSGKTTLAKAVAQGERGLFRLGLDDFDELIGGMEDREGGKLIAVETEFLFHRTIRMFADQGIDIIVDHVLHDRVTREDFLATLAAYPVMHVGIKCPLDLLRSREKARMNRRHGLAEEQYDRVHQDMVYDLEIWTDTEPIEESAGRLRAAILAFRQGLGMAAPA